MDARVARTHETVMKTATELLVEGGPEALTIDAVVARSGVAKTTVYRHWESRDVLVQAVFQNCAPTVVAPPEGLSFDEELRHVVAQLAATLTEDRWQRLFPELIRLRAQNPCLAELSEKLDHEQTSVLDEVLRRGVTEGRLPASVVSDHHTSAMLLIGPLLMATMLDASLVTTELQERTVEQFLLGAAATLDREVSAGR